MYEEASAIPFIMSGPDVPAGKVVHTPISLIDCYPTVLEAVGCAPSDNDIERPGDSLWEIASAQDHDRAIFGEYHAIASSSAYYMLRDRRYKYVYHVNAPAQLFDLTADPDELNDLARPPDRQTQNLLADFETQLRAVVDPEAVDQHAKKDQWKKIESFGGRDAVAARGEFVNSPVPGEAPRFRQITTRDVKLAGARRALAD